MRLRFSKPRFHLPPALLGAAALLIVFGATALAQQAAPATAPVGADATVAGTQVREQTMWELFRAGGPFMYALLASSILAIAIIFERLVSLRRSNVIPTGFIPGLMGVFRDPLEDRQRAIDYCRGKDSSIARVVSAGLQRLPRGGEAAEKAMEDAGANEALKLRRNVRMLYAIGSVATLLGLIGTISGMIKAFQVASGGGMGKAELLAKGIYEAMVNTFGGLAVAIVCTAFYYFFLGKIERHVADMNDALGTVEDKIGSVQGPRASSSGLDEMEAVGVER